MGEAARFAMPVSILALTIGLALVRPQLASLRIGIAGAALIGATLVLLSGVVPLDLAWNTVRRLAVPLTTIVSLMTITLVAARVGLLELLGEAIARGAGGDGRRLFTLIFWSGTAVGALFTNDAAILLFTPMVLIMMDRVALPEWRESQRLPYYFAVLYVGNLVGAFVISNPINIVAASFFGIDFVEYSMWMLLPAVVSMAVSWWGLRIAFRRDLPLSCRRSERALGLPKSADRRLLQATAGILVLTLLGFLTERLTGLPTWMVAATGALSLLTLLARRGESPLPILARIDWHVLVFVCGIMIVTVGLRNAGITHVFGDIIARLGGGSLPGLLLSTSLTAAVSSAFINNHSTVGLMIWVIEDFSLPALQQNLLVYAALIGGDLGPKMLPVGSLAALMWFRMLHLHGVSVSVWRYIVLGIPITLAAVLASVLTLILQWWLVSG
ncbi:hypothetical protein CKO31_21325 [Thiohalocapsa halophila]|uniref:Arsenic transporter n=1 Tax=Thiohalocapsa halophila TaxID=69359 RepID=A0ABS1CMS6_9GAMM|nr:ArsB/NhaD family transporter [Thiohalocapsa halophila]MBK1633247.1 hypothetical protein [Thiohalocapsa halophila]